MSASADATDAINRDEIPRQYNKTVKTYFDRLTQQPGGAKSAAKPAESSAKKDGGE